MRSVLVAALISFLCMGKAFAWFFQPPPSDTVPTATVQQFSDASSTALEAFSLVLSTFAQAEKNEVAVTDIGELSRARDLLNAAAQQFAALPTEQLTTVTIPREALAIIDQDALSMFEGRSLNSLEDLANFAKGLCTDIAAAVGQLIEVKFGPENSGSREPRLAVNQLSYGISQFMIVLNTASGALAQQS